MQFIFLACKLLQALQACGTSFMARESTNREIYENAICVGHEVVLGAQG
jgi:hypothetical protein